MAVYDDMRKQFSRTPVWYVKLTLDLCNNTFGSAPCTATGTGDKKCFNTYATCKDRANYSRGTKDYRFCTNGKMPFNNGERPYIASVTQLPTEISNSLPVLGRVKVRFHDEPDTDVGIDPYVTNRSSVQGTFWRKLIKRNPNYKGRPMEVYEGYDGLPESEFQQRFAGKIENIAIGARGSVEVSGIDTIGDLTRVKIPQEFDIKLGVTLASTDTTITFKGADVSKLTGSTSGSTGSTETYYLRVGDEIMSYVGTDFNPTSNQITNMVRGVAGTPSSGLSENDDVAIVPHYNGNVFAVMHQLLVNSASAIGQPGAGISTAYVNSTAFTYWENWTVGSTEVTVDGWIDEVMPVSDAYFDMANLMDVKSWVGEDLKITVDRRVPNLPDRTYHKISDEANIVLNTDALDGNEGSRFTRNYLYWSYKPATDFDKGKNFARRDAYVSLTLESSNYYGESIIKQDRTRFFRQGVMSQAGQNKFVQNRQRRWLQARRNALPLIDVQLEHKDSNIKTGDFCKLNTDLFTDDLGNPVSSAICQVVRRSITGDRVSLRLEKQSDNKVGFIQDTTAGAGSSAYSVATDAQLNYAFIAAADSASSTDAVMGDGTPAYLIY